MSLSEREDYRELHDETQRQWRPMDGVGEMSNEHFVGNYMLDSLQISVDKLSNEHSMKIVESDVLLKHVKPLAKNVHHLDISEHRALTVDEHLAHICVSHIESSNLVYIMTENDYERAMELLQAMKYLETREDQEIFKPMENRLCAVENNNEWLRARCLLVSTDKQIVRVQYIDWGNTVHVKATEIRQLPKEFYQESACCISCRLDGVDDIKFDSKTLNLYHEILIGSDREEFDLEIVVTKIGKMNESPHIVLYRKSINLNDEVYKQVSSNKTLTDGEHLIEQFTHELPLTIGEEYRALLSSFSGRDGSFYILIDNHNYNQLIEQVLNQMTDEYQSPILIRPWMMVCVQYTGQYARAWIQSTDNEQYQVFYVDWGNEEKVSKDRIRLCPETIRYIPWLANRVKFHDEQLTNEEFDEFWKTIENDHCQVVVIDQHHDHYSIEIKYNYLSMLRKRRAILVGNQNSIDCSAKHS